MSAFHFADRPTIDIGAEPAVYGGWVVWTLDDAGCSPEPSRDFPDAARASEYFIRLASEYRAAGWDVLALWRGNEFTLGVR